IIPPVRTSKSRRMHHNAAYPCTNNYLYVESNIQGKQEEQFLSRSVDRCSAYPFRHVTCHCLKRKQPQNAIYVSENGTSSNTSTTSSIPPTKTRPPPPAPNTPAPSRKT